jgi:hypothetical protein
MKVSTFESCERAPGIPKVETALAAAVLVFLVSGRLPRGSAYSDPTKHSTLKRHEALYRRLADYGRPLGCIGKHVALESIIKGALANKIAD